MKQPRERFPRTIRTVEELPPFAAEVLRQHPIDGIRHMIVVPPGEYPIRRTIWRLELAFRWRETPQRALIFAQDALTVIEAHEEGSPAITTIPLAALVEIHLYLVLLYSWIEFAWVEAGTIRRLRVEYNSVGERQIWRGLTQIREALTPAGVGDSPPEIADSPASFPFKFRAYVYDSLLDHESLRAAVYEPAIRAGKSSWSSLISPNRAIAVTDRALIVIEDQRDRRRFGDASEADYTVSRHFYPLDCLRAVHIESGTGAEGAAADVLLLAFERGGVRHDVVLPLTQANTRTLDAALRDHALARAALSQ